MDRIGGPDGPHNDHFLDVSGVGIINSGHIDRILPHTLYIHVCIICIVFTHYLYILYRKTWYICTNTDTQPIHRNAIRFK